MAMLGTIVKSESVQVMKSPNGLDQRAQIGYPRKIIQDHAVSVTGVVPATVGN